MFHDCMDTPLTPDNSATLDDVNLMAAAMMEHVTGTERLQALKNEDLEAAVVALRQIVQKLVQQLAPTDHRPPITDHRPPASAREPVPTDPRPPITDHHPPLTFPPHRRYTP